MCHSFLDLLFIVDFLHGLCFLAQSFLAPEKLPLLKAATASGAAAPHFTSEASSFLCDTMSLSPFF